jgi:signal transduction histidine kinase
VLAIALSGGLASMHYSTFTGIYTLALPLYTVAAWEPATRAGAGLGLWIAGATFAGMLRSAPVGGLLGALIMGCAVWTVGRVMRSQRTLAAQLAGAAAGLAAARVERERHAIIDERDRIARDVHALVSYGVVAMVVQAGATRALVANAPDRAARAMDAIERTGRDALAQMRDVLGVLHDPRREPQSAVA